jgi:hypothetical protein
MMRTLLLPLALIAPLPAAAQAQAPAFDPIAFFTGATRGTGRLKVALKPGEAIDVRGAGRVEPDGTLVLRQTVERHGRDPERREWRIRQTALGRYTGTLSSATGPVDGRIEKGRLKLSYKMKGGLSATQWLTAAADGQSAQNRMTVRRLGVPVATINETIRRSAY